MIVVVLVLASAFWAEYSARNSCGSIGGSEASSHRVDDSFGRYWGAIYPGSSLVRTDFLWAVKHLAETASSSGGQATFSQRALDGGTA
jgi:hypothetical protein